MNLGQYSLAMAVLAVIGWILVTVVVVMIDPAAAGGLGFGYFYASLFFAVMTSLALLGLLWRRIFVRQQSITTQVLVALRQGILLAVAVTGSFLLLSFGLLSLLNALLLIALLAAIEFFAHRDFPRSSSQIS
ncbi:MAG: hypothetical protein AAB817_01425 [Patescibacteria group bacterium]